MGADRVTRVLLLANYLNDRQESMQRFASLLAEALPKRGIAVEIIRPKEKLGRLKRSGHGIGKWLGYADKFVLFPRALRRRLQRRQPGEVLHICDHSNAVYTAQASPAPHLITCHDMLAIRSALDEIPENRTSASGKSYQRMILNGLRRAARVTCVSNSTRADVLRLANLPPERVTVTYNGLNYPYRPMPRDEAAARLGKIVAEKFILHVGGNQWYKNRHGVVRIYEALVRLFPDAPRLVLVGKPWPGSLRSQIQQSNLASRIVEVTDVANEDLRALYSSAELFLFPSLMEGFGWPIIEAQACGARVVTTDAAPMTEVGGTAAVYIDPRNPAAAADSLLRVLLEGETDRAARVQSGLANSARFSTEAMIDGYLREYQLCL